MPVDVLKETRFWINNVVIGLNLCPFASSVLKSDTVQMTVCSQTNDNELLEAVLKQLDILHKTSEEKISTSLLIFNQALSDFEQFLALVDVADNLLVEVGLQSYIQIASFHPHYYFDGVNIDDASNYSNRSPHPMLHFLRESQVTKALENYTDPEQIPNNNINRLRLMGKQAILELINNDDG